jgi:TDG/mug DNA glycosylase family protein
MAASPRSAELHAYYAGIGHKFWKVLWDIRLTPEKIAPQDFYSVLKYGIGLTDVVKTQSGTDNRVQVTATDVAILKAKIIAYAPRIIGFNGKRGCSRSHRPQGGLGSSV